MASGAGSSINASGLTVDVSNSGGGRGAFLQNGAAIALTNGSVTTSGITSRNCLPLSSTVV